MSVTALPPSRSVTRDGPLVCERVAACARGRRQRGRADSQGGLELPACAMRADGPLACLLSEHNSIRCAVYASQDSAAQLVQVL